MSYESRLINYYKATEVGKIVGVNDDGSYDVLVANRPYPYTHISVVGNNKGYDVGDSVVLAFYGSNRDVPVILCLSAYI